MPQYVLRKSKYVEITKFDDTAEALETYVFYARGCSCPAGRRGCKHTKILKQWQKDKEVAGAVYDDEANLINILAVV